MRELLASALLAVGVLAVTSVPASAAVSSSFSNGVLTVNGDSLNNTITISRNAAGTILVNGGAVAVVGGTPTVANTSLIKVFGHDGQDVITLNQANGALPAAQLFGANGNDTLVGGADDDVLVGGPGNDIADGGTGDNVVLDAFGANAVTSATAAGRDWLKAHARELSRAGLARAVAAS